MNTSQVENSSRRFKPWIRALILFLVYEFLTIGGAFLINSLFSPQTELQTNIVRAVMCLIYTLSILLLLKVVDRKPISYLKLQVNKKGLIGFIVGTIITGLVVVGAAFLAPLIFKEQLAAPDARGWGMMFSAFMAAYVLQGFPEELAYRGYLNQTLEKKPIPTILISALLFMAMHWNHFFTYQGILAFFEFTYPFAFGLLAGVLLYWTGSTWAAVAVHGGIHIFDTITDNFGMLNGSYRTLLTSFLMILVSVIIILKNPEKFR